MISLINLRLERRKSLEDVASDIGVCWQSLYRYEKKKSMPRLDNACKLADYYGVTLEDLRNFFAC